MTTRSNGGKPKRIQLAEEPKKVITSGPKAPQLRGVIYARYSDGGNQTDQSLEGQLRECRKYAQEHNIRIVEEYLDPHISGKEAEKRPEFQRMIRDSDKHQFDVVIVWKTDRFARNRYDSARYKERLKRNGISIRYAAENIPDTAEGIILESMLEGMAEYYSADLQQKILRGMRESAYKCKILTRPPMGYKPGPEGEYTIDESVAPYIRQIFQMYVDGEKMRVIAEKMNRLGLRTVQNNPLNANAIAKVIQNERYIGVYEYKNGGIRIEDAIPAIIDKDLFYAAQQRRLSQKAGTYSKKNYGGSAKHTYLLSGILFCGECGSTMFGETSIKFGGTSNEYSNSYYACRGHRKGRKGVSCEQKAIPKWILEDIVKNTVKRILVNPVVLDVICKAVVQADVDHNLESRLKALNYQKKKKQAAIDNILTALENGFYSDSVLRRLKTLEAEVQSLELEIRQCKTSTNEISKKIKWLLTKYQPLADSDEEYWNDIIHCFVKSVTCFANRTVLIRLNLYNMMPPDGPVVGLEVSENIDGYLASCYDEYVWAHPPNLHQIKHLESLRFRVFFCFVSISL